MNLKPLADLVKNYLGLTESHPEYSEEKFDYKIREAAFLARFSVTNESLDAIVEGLDLKPDDSVLAIAGSGDQAFAMLEYGCKVNVVDFNKDQLELVRLRAEALRRGKYELFFCKKKNIKTSMSQIRDAYFSKEGRLDKIRANIENLTILEPSNVFSLKPGRKFSKIYLSNVFDSLDFSNKRSKLSAVEELLSSTGLIYITYASSINERDLPASLKTDSQLTEKATSYDVDWLPIVYRKVETPK